MRSMPGIDLLGIVGGAFPMARSAPERAFRIDSRAVYLTAINTS
jgi:hypothetical protein